MSATVNEMYENYWAEEPKKTFKIAGIACEVGQIIL